MEKYTSHRFEKNTLGSDIVEDLKGLERKCGVTLEKPVTLYRGEIRPADKTTEADLQVVSCDIGDCITSWSTSPARASYYSTHLIHNATPNQNQTFSHSHSVLYCTTFPKGTRVLPMHGMENEVLLVGRPRVTYDQKVATADIEQLFALNETDDDEYDYALKHDILKFHKSWKSGYAHIVSGTLLDVDGKEILHHR